ncbi:MAG TPA: branched-chain amino acid ABC transporter substrate-binding protein [Actinomycetota bacterium]|nr:branched-chain amino acid ABC transporter substrate-binding protein [Actinomycetota bacterium]
MKDIPELRARLQEMAAASPAAKPIDARARRKIRGRQWTLIAGATLSVVVLATTGFALTRSATRGPDDRAPVARERGAARGDCVWTIAVMGALSGDYAPIGAPIARAVDYAVAESRERGDLACEVELRNEDSQGNPNIAPSVARTLAGDSSVVACVCPHFSAETLASGRVFSSAGLLMTGPAHNLTIDEQGFETWFGVVALDDAQGDLAGRMIAAAGADDVAVIHDGGEYSRSLAAAVQGALGDRVGGTFSVTPGEDDHSQVVEQVAAMEPGFVFFGGYAPEAGPLLRQLRDAGVTAPFLAGPGSRDPLLGRLAGAAADGALAVCPCADPTKIASAADFVAGMRADHGGADPGTFAVEAYDVTTLVVEALRAYEGDPADTHAVRAHVVRYFDETNGYDGLARTYAWEDDGEPVAGGDAVWVYEWDQAEDGFVARGPVSDYLD